MSCKGFCYCPHGGWATLGLLVASAAGLAATVCGALSCRFVRLSFEPASGGGCFEDAFRPDVTGGAADAAIDDAATAVACQVGLGLYQWLQPNPGATDPGDWAAGTCVGYQQTMLERLDDPQFQVARGFGVFAVLLSVVLFWWDVALACLELNGLQVWLLRLCSALAVASSGLTFLLNGSAACGSSGNLFQGSGCAVDQGALAMLAASILWFVHLVVSAVWIRRSPCPSTPRSPSSDEPTDRDDDSPAIEPNHRHGRGDSGSLKSARRGTRHGAGSGQRFDEPEGSTAYEGGDGGDPNAPPQKPRSWLFGNRLASGGDSPPGARSVTSVRRQHQHSLTVDDVTSKEQLEVYLSRRLDAIEKHIDED